MDDTAFVSIVESMCPPQDRIRKRGIHAGTLPIASDQGGFPGQPEFFGILDGYLTVMGRQARKGIPNGIQDIPLGRLLNVARNRIVRQIYD